MRASTSGELVRDEVRHVPMRRWGRLWGPARRSAASGPDPRLLAPIVLLAALLVAAQPLGATTAPGPDPHPSATQPSGTPTPDPAPRGRQTAPAPDSATDVETGSSPAYEPAAHQSSPPTTSLERPRATRPAAAKPKPQARTKPKAAAAKAPSPTVRRGNDNQPARVAETSTAVVMAAKSATDPMLLGAFALLTLALSSGGLLLVLHRSERWGARA